MPRVVMSSALARLLIRPAARSMTHMQAHTAKCEALTDHSLGWEQPSVVHTQRVHKSGHVSRRATDLRHVILRPHGAPKDGTKRRA